MATFPSVEAATRAMSALERDLERRRRDMGEAVATKVKPEAYRAAAADLGGDPKFSGWRPWLELQVRPKQYGAALIPTRYSAGPWTVAQYGRNTAAGPFARMTRGGEVRRYKRGSRAGQVMLRSPSRKRWNGITPAFNTADEARSRVERAAPPIAEKELKMVVGRHFDIT